MKRRILVTRTIEESICLDIPDGSLTLDEIDDLVQSHLDELNNADDVVHSVWQFEDLEPKPYYQAPSEEDWISLPNRKGMPRVATDGQILVFEGTEGAAFKSTKRWLSLEKMNGAQWGGLRTLAQALALDTPHSGFFDKRFLYFKEIEAISVCTNLDLSESVNVAGIKKGQELVALLAPIDPKYLPATGRHRSLAEAFQF